VELQPIQPEGWAAPRGYQNGMLCPAGARLVFVAGQIAWDAEQRLVGAGNFVQQFSKALENVVAVVRAAGGAPEHLARLTVYVVDKQQYLSNQKQIGAEYRRHMGRHYCAMALVEVAGLLEWNALVEIEATAAIS
jgi:enamine deaminase RidA (YjgF/YER057c/UK114 family)